MRTGRNFMSSPPAVLNDVTVNGDLTMASGKRLFYDPGTAAAPGLADRVNPTNGISANSTILQLCRSGAVALDLRGLGVQIATGLDVAGGLTTLNYFRYAAETVKTINYTLSTTDMIVIMNGAGLTAQLPTVLAATQRVLIKNIDAGTCTIDRNGTLIDGAAANITLASMEAADLYCDGTNWYRLNNIP